MALGKRRRGLQADLWIPTDELPKAASHPFYQKINEFLKEANFDDRVEKLVEPYYAQNVGRPSIPPGVYFRALMVGYFEGIDSERGIAWRCADSLGLRSFLGYKLTEATPDHSTISATRRRLPVEIHCSIFSMVLEILAERGLIQGNTLGVDASTLEANAALRSIVRRDTGEGYREFVERLAKASGIETPTAEELAEFDRKRKKKVSNEEWYNPNDPEAKVGKMKDGRTHLTYKAEHVVDLETGAIIAAEIHPADEGDTKTGPESLDQACQVLSDLTDQVESYEQRRAEVIGDKGYHSGELLAGLESCGWRTYISEPHRPRRRWRNRKGELTEEKEAEQKAVYANRRRIRGNRGKELLRFRGELLERTFAHLLETGGMRRVWLRGCENIAKRYLVHAGAFNLSLVMRAIFGGGTPRQMAALFSALFAAFLERIGRFFHLLPDRRLDSQIAVSIVDHLFGREYFGQRCPSRPVE